EKMASELMSASLDYYRAVRDAASEAAFFKIYGNLLAMDVAEPGETHVAPAGSADARQQPLVRAALGSIDKGGYDEAVARVVVLLSRRGEPLKLSIVELKHEMHEEFRELLPNLPPDELRRIRGKQEIIVHYEPEKALETLPALLADKADKERMRT